MSLEVIKSLGNGGGFLNDRLPRILTELQGITFSFLGGAAASAAIVDAKGPLFGVDTLLLALNQDDTSGVLTDVTATQSIIDSRASGTMTVGASITDGNSCVVNGRTYTAVTVTPTQTNRGLLANQFYSGLQSGQAADGTVLTKAHLLAAGMSDKDIATVLTTANKEEYIAAWSLAQAINSADSLALTASATLASGVVTIYGDVESTASYAMTTGTNLTRGAATITGGVAGTPSGTVTLATAVATNFVAVGGVTFTAVDSGVAFAVGSLKFPAILSADITSGVARARLMETGLSSGAADAYAGTATQPHADNCTAYLLAAAINGQDGALVTATATAGSAVVAISQDSEGAALTLTATGTTVAVTGSGTLTVASRGWKNSSSSATAHQLVVWFKKSRVVGQA